MRAFYHYYFFPVHQAFWQGAIWGNILASIVVGTVVITCTRYLFKLVRRQHKEHTALLMGHHQALTQSLSELHKKLEENK